MQLEREHGETENYVEDKKDNKDAHKREQSSESDVSSSDEDKVPIYERRQRREQTRRGQLLTFRDVEESLETFIGDDKVDVKGWIKNFEKMAALCKWFDIEKVAYVKLLRLLRGSAKLFINYERCTKTWKKMRRALKKEFTNIVDSHTIHQELSKHKKKI